MTMPANELDRPIAMTTPSDREIRIERVFNASRDRVWRAYTDPALLVQWWGGGHRIEIERFEPERGGHWRIVDHSPAAAWDASGASSTTPSTAISSEQPQGFEGRFREVTPPERIVQTFEWDGMPGYVSLETTTFEDLGDGRTRVVNTSLLYTTEERDSWLQSGMEEGVVIQYAALDRLLASM